MSKIVRMDTQRFSEDDIGEGGQPAVAFLPQVRLVCIRWQTRDQSPDARELGWWRACTGCGGKFHA